MAPNRSALRPSRRRWLAAPALATAILALTLGAPAVAGNAQADSVLAGTPAAHRLAELPPATAPELVARVIGARWADLSGTIELHSRLGLPDVGVSLGGGLLSGIHRFGLSVADSSHLRIVMSGAFAETDLVRDGPDLWLWQSDRLRVTHARLGPTGTGPSGLAGLVAGIVGPALLAGRILDALRPSTVVSVAAPAVVGGRPAYQLVFSPRAPGSLVRDVVLAVDGDSGLPLRLQVFGREAKLPAIDLAFISLHRTAPTSTARGGSRRHRVPGAPAGLGGAYRSLAGVAHREAGSATELLGAVLSSPPRANRRATTSRTRVMGAGWARVVAARIDRSILANGPAAVVLSQSPTVAVGAGTVRRGSARLISTVLLDALVLDDGTVYAGPVTPKVLVADAIGAR
ncbi:MAG: hypothetical protein ACYDAD_00095 [Acidimicrobiales bacterium]